nr:vacuolar protein sorting-associated protein 25 [Tanacetum cinerariifolium]
MDKNRRQCLILWHRIKDWADLTLNFVKENGLEDGVMTVDEIRTGVESRGTDIHGMDRTVLLRALKLLENKGKLAIFKGTSADDEGSSQKLFIIFTCIGILAINPHTVSSIRIIDSVTRLNHRVLKTVVMEDDHKANPSSAAKNKKFDAYKTSKRTVRKGSDPIHNRA